MRKAIVKRLKPPPQKTTRAYRQLWRVVDGAIGTAFAAHPSYLADHGRLFNNARRSIAKRVTGAVLGYAEQSAESRSGVRPAADMDSASSECAVPAGAAYTPANGAVWKTPSPACPCGRDKQGDDALIVIPAFLGLPA